MKAHRDRAQEAQRALLVARRLRHGGAPARADGAGGRSASPRGSDRRRGRSGRGERRDLRAAPDGVSSPVRVPGGDRHLPARQRRTVPPSAARPGPPGGAPRGAPAEGARRGEGAGGEARGGGAQGRGPARARAPGRRDLRRGGPVLPAEPLGDRALGQVLSPVALTLGEGGVGGPVEGPGGFSRRQAHQPRTAGPRRLRSGAGRHRGAAPCARSARGSGRRGSPRPARARRSRSTASS